MQQNTQVNTLIIGSGLTGLTTAHFLNREKAPFLVLEKNLQPGGVIQTFSKDGFVYETGPNTGVLGGSEIIEVFDDLAHLCRLETANESAEKRYILKNGQWQPLPSSLVSGIKTPLFTFRDKLRILGEPFRKKGTNPHETLSQLVKRRMGQSFLDYAVDPFIIGVYAGDPDLLIPKYALPKLYNLEQKYGSFIGGSIKKQKEPKTPLEKRVTRKVFSVKGGLQNLVQALHTFNGVENFRFGCTNITVKPEKKGFLVSFAEQDKHQTVLADKVIFTGGSFELSHSFPFVDQTDIETLTQLNYAKVTEVTLGFKKWKGFKLDGFGGLIPSKEKREILGVLFMSSLFENRAPQGGALLTVFMGGIRNPKIAEMNDQQIYETVEKEISQLMQLTDFKPELFTISRYEHAIPQYDVNSGKRFETILKLENHYPGLILGGNMRDGIGMADRVKQGKMLANQALAFQI